jgi:hypothetical protein
MHRAEQPPRLAIPAPPPLNNLRYIFTDQDLIFIISKNSDFGI